LILRIDVNSDGFPGDPARNYRSRDRPHSDSMTPDARHPLRCRCQNRSGSEIEDFDLPGFLDDVQVTSVTRRRARENRLP
jgi:hypothetical protein